MGTNIVVRLSASRGRLRRRILVPVKESKFKAEDKNHSKLR